MPVKGPGAGIRVLMVDDERHIVRLIEVNLTRQGHEVWCACGGAEAIDLLRRHDFDLAVIDRDMPGMSGLELLEWIRANDATKDLKVVMLDKNRHDDDDPPNPTAATRWLTKPFKSRSASRFLSTRVRGGSGR